MNHRSRAEKDLVALLNLAGPEWMSDRPWRFEEFSSRGSRGDIRVDGAGFCFQWEERGGAVTVSYFEGGGHQLPPTPGRMLAVEVVRGTIRVHMPGREAKTIGSIESPLYQQALDCVARPHGPIPDSKAGWHESMMVISSAMNLVCLTHRAALAAAAPARKGNRSPRKEQIVTQLHEWLRGNLVHSARLSDAAARFDKSPRQLIRILKATTGAGFAEHLNMHRLALARSLLMRTGQSVREIATASGFNSREQFIRSFNRCFGWTPLQFRKAWNDSCLNGNDLVPLCRVSGREPVNWLPEGATATTPPDEKLGAVHTMVVTNALYDIAELFWVSPEGRQTRIDVLESGGMVFVNRDSGGSSWLIKVPASGRARYFTTPDDHALAIISDEVMGAQA